MFFVSTAVNLSFIGLLGNSLSTEMGETMVAVLPVVSIKKQLFSFLFQAIDEPPYLTVGTDVSAKYRGAFCEAKIKTAKRLVKVKVCGFPASTSLRRGKKVINVHNGAM